LEVELTALANPARAKSHTWFFKTGPGQYGEGDVFLGIKVPEMRRAALKYRELALPDLARLLASKFHEHRAAALEILVVKYENALEPEREEIFRFYLANTARVNNWDLVDASAEYIVGKHLVSRPRALLDELAVSESIWERRIAIVATFAFLKKGDTASTYRIARKLLSDKHDLIHKAVGWALRVAGKTSRPKLLGFIEKNYARIPRTTLRYAIEHLPPEERKAILTRKTA
jgi:3-methyladenine DNA glycosylase AlkD